MPRVIFRDAFCKIFGLPFEKLSVAVIIRKSIVEELEIREFISIDTGPRDSYDWYVHLLVMMKKEDIYRDIKTETRLG